MSNYTDNGQQDILLRPDQASSDTPMTDKFWFKDISILFKKNRLIEFFPNYQMTLIEKLNAIARLSIYLGLVLYLITKRYLYLYIPLLVMLFTLFIFTNQRENMELYYNSYQSQLNKINGERLISQKCTEPTINNPFMNIDLIGDSKTKEAACPSWDNKNIQKDIETKFDYNLYKDVSDLFGKSNSQREYYTMPSTTIPNKQTEFAKWCYATGPTCKESSVDCANPWSPGKSTTDVYKYVPVKF